MRMIRYLKLKPHKNFEVTVYDFAVKHELFLIIPLKNLCYFILNKGINCETQEMLIDFFLFHLPIQKGLFA